LEILDFFGAFCPEIILLALGLFPYFKGFPFSDFSLLRKLCDLGLQSFNFFIQRGFGFRRLISKIDPASDILKRLSSRWIFLEHAKDQVFNVCWDPGRKLGRRILDDINDSLERMVASEHLEEDHACSPDV